MMIQKNVLKNKHSPCHDSMIITDFGTGETICQKCGRVIEEKIPDFKNNRFVLDENSHFGDKTSIALYDHGLSTNIGKINSDFGGKRLNHEMQQSMNRIRIWDARSKIKPSNRNVHVALYEMYKLKEKLSLSDIIIERAAYMYRKATKANLIRGRSMEAMVGACLYASCREFSTTRRITDISEQLQLSSKTVGKAYKILFQNLRLSIPTPEVTGIIIKIANNLGILESTKREAIKMYHTLRENGLTEGKSPHTVAACVIYMAGIKINEYLNQRKIAEGAGITDVALRNGYRAYKNYVGLI